jgi:hypothetical protein
MALLVVRPGRQSDLEAMDSQRAMKFNPELMILAEPHQLADGYSMRDLSVK